MKQRVGAAVLTVLLAGLTFVSCGDDDTATGQVILEFITADLAGPIDDFLPVATLNFTNEAGQVFSIETLVYFISRVSLVRTDGSDFASDEVAYIDPTRGLNARRVSFTGVSAGTYNRVRFTFGLNAEDNVTGSLADRTVINAEPLDVTNMAWPEPMGGGYHYMKMEGKYRNPASLDTLTYATHLGRSGATHNFFTVDLQVPQFTVDEGDRWIVEIFHAFRQWYEDPHTYAFPAESMIMGDPAAQTTLKENASTGDGRVFVANRTYLDN